MSYEIDKITLNLLVNLSNNILEEQYFVSQAMIRYGGSFASNLGQALAHADINNTVKIKSTWPEEWQKYLDLGKELYK